MKHFLAVLASVAVCWAQMAMAETRFSPVEGDFSVCFPSAPTAESQAATSVDDSGFRRYVSVEGKRTYTIVVDQYPKNIRVPAPTAATYQRLLWSRAHEGASKMVSSRPALLAKLPSWEGTYVLPDGRAEVVRVLVLGDRIYQVSFIHDGQGNSDSAAARLFESFQIKTSGLSGEGWPTC